MEITIEHIKTPSVQISLNGHKYYLSQYIIDKYFVTSDITSDRFVDIHNYIVFAETNDGTSNNGTSGDSTLDIDKKASIETCDIIALDLASDLRNELMKKDIQNNPDKWLIYYTFCDLYLKIDPFILGGHILTIKDHFIGFRNYVQGKLTIKNAETFELIEKTMLDAISQVFDTEYPIVAQNFGSGTKLKHNKWRININRYDRCMLIFWQLFKVNKTNLFDIFCSKIEMPEIYNRFLKLNPEDYTV